MAYHSPGHPIHRLSWFPRKPLLKIMTKTTLEKVEEIWLQYQDEFWDQVDKLEKFGITNAGTGQKLLDESDPNAIGIPNYAGLPTHVIKLNDLKRLRECPPHLEESKEIIKQEEENENNN